MARRWLVAGFLVILLVGAVVAVVTVVAVLSVDSDVARFRKHPLAVSNAAAQMNHDVEGMCNHTGLAVLGADLVVQTSEWDEHLIDAEGALQVMETQYLGDPADIRDIREEFGELVAVQRSMLSKVGSGQAVPANDARTVSELEDSLRQRLEGVSAFAFARADQFEDEVRSTTRSLAVVVAVSSGVGVGAVVLLGLGLVRSFNRQVEKLEASAKLIDQNVMVLQLDKSGRVQSVSSAMNNYLGGAGAELVGTRSMGDNTQKSEERLDTALRQADTGQAWVGEVIWEQDDGSELLAGIRLLPVFDQTQGVAGYTAILTDLTAERDSHTDALTNLPNRRQFEIDFRTELNRARRNTLPMTVAIIDLDHFKHVNDQYGHPIGDRVLVHVGELLQSGLRRANDMIYRIGGDEFAALLVGPDPQKATEILNTLRQHVHDSPFNEPETPTPITPSVSIGAVTAIPHQESTRIDYYEQADRALFTAKQARNEVQLINLTPPPN